MKPVFKCDYCKFMGTEEEVREHEPICTDNYDRKSCYTCVHKQYKPREKQWCYECKAGKEIPEGQQFVNCDMYEWDEVDHTHSNPTAFNNLFGGIFG
jgi:hypothetical protein